MMKNGCSSCLIALLALYSASCSDPSAPPGEGAASIAIFPSAEAPNGYGCTGHSIRWSGSDVGPTAQETGRLLLDGHDGASVTCSVAGSGKKSYKISGTIDYMSARFTVSGTIGSDKTGKASLDLWDDLIHTTIADENCTITLSEKNHTVESGAVWASISCSHLATPLGDDRYLWCAASATIVFKSCEE